MKRLIPCAAAILAAVCALLLFAGAVQSGGLTDRSQPGTGPIPIQPEHDQHAIGGQGGLAHIQSTPEYSLTRLVTITVGTTSLPFTPSLNSRWQIDLFSQQFLTASINLPSDAGDIIVNLLNGDFGIDPSGPTIYVTNSQGLYYEYHTDQQAVRFGNQILISQVYRFNRSLHYIGTLVFTAPYQYVGYSGYAPTQTGATELYWDQAFPETQLNEFQSAIWLIQPGAFQRPDLQIVTATASNQLNHLYVTADIRNNGPITAGAPAYLNLYDRLAPSVPPTGPLDLTDGWCSLTPVSMCANGTSDPLPAIPPGETVVYTAEYDLRAINGQHDIYLFVDALGSDQGLNVESAEGNNWTKVGSFAWHGDFIFLPLVRRG
jgi:hypothetical protein